jgi:hypothetical protein
LKQATAARTASIQISPDPFYTSYVSAAKFEVFTAVKIHVEVFWVVTPCSVVVGYQHPEDRSRIYL